MGGPNLKGRLGWPPGLCRRGPFGREFGRVIGPCVCENKREHKRGHQRTRVPCARGVAYLQLPLEYLHLIPLGRALLKCPRSDQGSVCPGASSVASTAATIVDLAPRHPARSGGGLPGGSRRAAGGSLRAASA
jgi:hypothetical protein